MQIYKDIDLLYLKNTVVTTGNFDGVHLGHQFLLGQLVELAKARHQQAVVVMFFPHPREVLSHDGASFQYLSSQEDKYEMFEKCGVDIVVQVPFSKDLARWTADDFVKHILLDKLGMATFLVGYDHKIGNPKSDTSIEPLAAKYGFVMQECRSFESPIGIVSSSTIREVLLEGEVSRATQLLGRPYSMHCTVVEGMKVGRSIGYPTANLHPIFAKRLIPAEGVYAVQIDFEGAVFGGMLMVGYRPTLNDGRGLTVEVHIFDFDKDIYGQNLDLRFIQYLRANRRFESVDMLREQLALDEVAAKSAIEEWV